MQKVLIISKADHPIALVYNGQGKIVSPRERFEIEDASLLELPLHPKLKIQNI